MKATTLLLSLPLMLTMFLPTGDAGAAGAYSKRTSKKANTPLERASHAIGGEQYEQAIQILEAFTREEPENADGWNLLAFSNRKLGRLDEARRYYARALAIDPKHRRAHEYLGELHLQEGNLEAAHAQLATLKQLCRLTCKERRQLSRAIKSYEREQQREE